MVDHPKTRRSRYSLRFLMMATAIAALVFALWASQVEPYRRQAAGLDRFGGFGLVESNQRWISKTGGVAPPGSPAGPEWKRRLVESVIGESRFREIRSLGFKPETPEEDLLYVLERMPFLQNVSFNRCKLSARTLQCLAKLPNLSELVIWHCDVSDEAIGHLSASNSIRRLILNCNPVSDDSVVSLSEIESLGELHIRSTDISEAGSQRFRNLKPGCEVHYQP